MSEETVRTLLELAARAPSGTNTQPWKVIALAGEARDSLCQAVMAAREKSTVDIGVRHIEKLTKRHYNAIDILWLRQIISDPYPRVLVWRKQN